MLAVTLCTLSFVVRPPLAPFGARRHAPVRAVLPPADGVAASASLGHVLVLLAENDGESTRPVADLVENDVAVAYLVVLAFLFSFLAYLALADQRAKKRKAEDMREVMAATERLREQGKLDEANVLEREMRRADREEKRDAKAAAKSAKKPPIGGQAEPEEGNRFARRIQARSGLDDDDEKPKRSGARARRSGRKRR
tara:strand:- start:150 stop:740 length:591 start_codon:yes stop_codon:yes gene_type:complete